MSLWRYPRTAAALCIAAVLACAAAPAAFLAASDAAYFGRVEAVADPYRAPTPTADDYYILRQLAARGQDTTARQTTPQQEQGDLRLRRQCGGRNAVLRQYRDKSVPLLRRG